MAEEKKMTPEEEAAWREGLREWEETIEMGSFDMERLKAMKKNYEASCCGHDHDHDHEHGEGCCGHHHH